MFNDNLESLCLGGPSGTIGLLHNLPDTQSDCGTSILDIISNFLITLNVDVHK